MKICSIVSGSSGNCVFVTNGQTRILVDAGSSGKKIEEGLKSIGENIQDIDALLVTHEHADHIQGVGILARRHGIQIFATKGTINAMLNGKTTIGKVDASLLNRVRADAPFFVGDIMITPFSVSHDAAEPVAYSFKAGKERIAMATDLGFYDDYILKNLMNSEVLYLEANHDIAMLEAGSYPFQLKERIKGPKGHLSNDSCAELLVKLCNGSRHKIKDVILAHLSEENNFPDLAYETVNAELKTAVAKEKRPELHVAPRYTPSFMAET